jgi:hypothetical protein
VRQAVEVRGEQPARRIVEPHLVEAQVVSEDEQYGRWLLRRSSGGGGGGRWHQHGQQHAHHLAQEK